MVLKVSVTLDYLGINVVLIRLTLLEDFINLSSRGAYYLKERDGYQYQMRPLIYDSKLKIDEETTMA